MRFLAVAVLIVAAGPLGYCGTLRSDYTPGFVGAAISVLLALLVGLVQHKRVRSLVTSWALVLVLALPYWIVGKGARFALNFDRVYGQVTILLGISVVASLLAVIVLRSSALNMWFATAAERELLEQDSG